MTHDYRRHGKTTLFAALDMKSGMVIGECLPRHRPREFLRFLRLIDRAVLKPCDVHLAFDNYATHKTPSSKCLGSKGTSKNHLAENLNSMKLASCNTEESETFDF